MHTRIGTFLPQQWRTWTAPQQSSPEDLNDRVIDTILRKDEASSRVSSPGNPVYRYDTNQLGSNDPIEDFSSSHIVSRNTLPGCKTAAGGDMMFFGIYDGHTGHHTGQRLSRELVPAVLAELNSVVKRDLEYFNAARNLQSLIPSSSKFFVTSSPSRYSTSKFISGASKMLCDTWDLLRYGLYSARFSPIYDASQLDLSESNLEKNPSIIHRALKNAFKKLDHEIIITPLRLYAERQAIMKRDVPVDNIKFQKEIDQSVIESSSGSCALLTYLDVANNMIHVACTGDSRAVMGVWERDEKKWRSRVLSEDQNGYTYSEIKRIRAEHPPSERDHIINGVRCLKIAVSRAFGDTPYKWTDEIYYKLTKELKSLHYKRRPMTRTPPYVTAEPEVTTCELADISKVPSNDRRFIVLASDGLWNELSCEEVVGLVGVWLDGNRKPQSRDNILKNVMATPPGKDASSNVTVMDEDRVVPHEFEFKDNNISTHLIRNALGGTDRQRISGLLSIKPSKRIRDYRDDITVTVILLGEQPE